MKLLLTLGKLLTLLFWIALLFSLSSPFASPLAIFFKMLAGLLLSVHVVSLLVLEKHLRARPHAWLDRLQILLFGAFHRLAPIEAEVKSTQPN